MASWMLFPGHGKCAGTCIPREYGRIAQRGEHPLIRPCPGHALAILALPWRLAPPAPGYALAIALAILAFDVRHKPNSTLAILAILAKFR